MCSKSEMRRNFLWHVVSKAWILFLRVNKPQRRMKMTGDWYNLNLLVKLMVLLCQTLSNLAITAIAEAILTPRGR